MWWSGSECGKAAASGTLALWHILGHCPSGSRQPRVSTPKQTPSRPHTRILHPSLPQMPPSSTANHVSFTLLHTSSFTRPHTRLLHPLCPRCVKGTNSFTSCHVCLLACPPPAALVASLQGHKQTGRKRSVRRRCGWDRDKLGGKGGCEVDILGVRRESTLSEHFVSRSSPEQHLNSWLLIFLHSRPVVLQHLPLILPRINGAKLLLLVL